METSCSSTVVVCCSKLSTTGDGDDRKIKIGVDVIFDGTPMKVRMLTNVQRS